MDVDDVRRLALALPESNEEPHFERSSFRVRGRIFATVEADGVHLNVFPDEHEARAAVADAPSCIEELWWGRRLSGVRVRLAEAPAELVAELLEEAWRRRASKRVVAAFDATRGS